MTFLYCLVQKSSKPGGERTRMWVALTIFLSYLLLDPLLNLNFGFDILNYADAYLIWAICDVFTLIIILFIAKNKKITKLPAKLYIVVGFSVNIALFIGMFADTHYGEYIGPWWFWNVYAVVVNVSDVMMIIALLCNKDFLGLVRGYNRLRGLKN
ncbi:hypothetical protein H5187_12815 [Pseudoalteromonas sp. SG44-1]|uniref:hypothetical protein n=1 Tax=Pseudoalteromonas sp. SG44-1 TaxID=2760964 RepID=UPI0016010C9C|nr:hypothetical protein [Pseudoalteromonas sp. SG44-1]MBB1418162.1 hypothetical protein [Pseudoalteromonas sp. SG44-1]